jgi:hypothetical protein
LLKKSKLKIFITFKVFEILNTLVTNSNILAELLFQIVFNTKNYLDKKEEQNKIEQLSLKKKFNEFILKSGEHNDDDSKYDIFIEFYKETAKFSLNSSLMLDLSKTSENGSFFIHNCDFHLKFLEYSIQLIKVIKIILHKILKKNQNFFNLYRKMKHFLMLNQSRKKLIHYLK